MERCQAHHGGQQGPDNYADKQILGSLQLLHCRDNSQTSLGRSRDGLIPGSDGGPGYSEDCRGEAQELQTKTR